MLKDDLEKVRRLSANSAERAVGKKLSAIIDKLEKIEIRLTKLEKGPVTSLSNEE